MHTDTEILDWIDENLLNYTWSGESMEIETHAHCYFDGSDIREAVEAGIAYELPEPEPLQCEGYRKLGGAFTCGGVPTWTQCEEDAAVLLTLVHKGESQEDLPTCQVCWKECLSTDGITILGVRPLD